MNVCRQCPNPADALNGYCTTCWFSKVDQEVKTQYHKLRLPKYGLTIETYDMMVVEQKNSCKICRTPFTRIPFIDHCHKCGKVRGLLCVNCNSGLGHFKDSPEFLASALSYITEHVYSEGPH